MVGVQSLRYRAYRHSQGTVHIAAADVSWQHLCQQHQHVALVRPTYTGICSADVRELRGERPGRSDFGHEVVATVLRSTHYRFNIGEPVVLNPFVRIVRETGFSEMMYLAGTEHLLGSALVKVPSDDICFSMAEPLACAIHAAHQSVLDTREPQLVFGAGFFGYLLYCYLEHRGVPVTLANRSPDRLSYLVDKVPGLRVSSDLGCAANESATVFLMQSQVDRHDVASAAHCVRQDGGIVVFGTIDRNTDPELHSIRNLQQRRAWSMDGKSFYLQGTLDASAEDLREALAILAQAEFTRKLTPILAEPLTFEQGARHLTQRSLSPRSYGKHIVAVWQ